MRTIVIYSFSEITNLRESLGILKSKITQLNDIYIGCILGELCELDFLERKEILALFH